MRGKKVLAALLAGSFLFSVAGCSKITSVNIDDFENAWAEADADEMSFEELDELDSGSMESQLEDGFYYRFEPGDLQYSNMVFPLLKMYHLDLNLDMDYIEEICMGAKVDSNLFDLDLESPSELEDLTLDGVAGIQITLEDPVDIDEFADGIEDMLDTVDVDVEELSSSEYRQTKNGLSLILRVSLQELAQNALDAGLIDAASARATSSEEAGELEEALENLEGDVYLYVVAQDVNIVILAGLSVNEPTEVLSAFTGAFGFTDPEDVDPNTAVAEAIADSYMDRLSGTLAMIETMEGSSDYSDDW